MHLLIGESYVITSDKYQFILNKKMTFKEGKNAGEPYLKKIGFYPRLNQLISALIITDALESDIKSIKELDYKITEFALKIEKFFINSIEKGN